MKVTMTNGSRLELDIAPYLDTVQFLPLKDRIVWSGVKAFGSCLRWGKKLELSIDTLLGMLKEGRRFGQEPAAIKEASAESGRLLRILLTNGSLIEINMRELLEYPLFAPLEQKALWKSLRFKEHSLIWENQGVSIEIQLDALLKYIA